MLPLSRKGEFESTTEANETKMLCLLFLSTLNSFSFYVKKTDLKMSLDALV